MLALISIIKKKMTGITWFYLLLNAHLWHKNGVSLFTSLHVFFLLFSCKYNQTLPPCGQNEQPLFFKLPNKHRRIIIGYFDFMCMLLTVINLN